ncbi:MAG: hypothetical protein K2L56_04515 [Prevotella sp.]|nr:hypothetical protein [Prevotella sp.]
MLLAASYVHADNVEEAKKQINSIKKNSQYIYAEATAATESEAKDLAEEMLYEEINTWAANQKKLRNSPTFVVNNKRELWTSMLLPRGNMYRSFVYVRKSDIRPADNTQVIANPNPTAAPLQSSSVSLIVPDAVRELAACTEYTALAEKMQAMKNQGRVKSYARYAQLNNPDACYLAIYNTAGKVVAVLTPGAQRMNISTGQSDGVANYRGCGAIGFEVAE